MGMESMDLIFLVVVEVVLLSLVGIHCKDLQRGFRCSDIVVHDYILYSMHYIHKFLDKGQHIFDSHRLYHLDIRRGLHTLVYKMEGFQYSLLYTNMHSGHLLHGIQHCFRKDLDYMDP